MTELIDYEGRKLTAAQIGQLEKCRAAARILRAAGYNARVIEFVTCRDPKSDAAGIRIEL